MLPCVVGAGSRGLFSALYPRSGLAVWNVMQTGVAACPSVTATSSTLWSLNAKFPFSTYPRRKGKRRLHRRTQLFWARKLRQKEGDFPIQLRPVEQDMKVRDLHDPALDMEADKWKPLEARRKPKPHEVREAVKKLFPSKNVGTVDDKLSFTEVADKKAAKLASSIPQFDVERDVGEKEAFEIEAAKARMLARRNFKWMPNPFSARPGLLGANPEAEAKYYETYFDGNDAPGDEHHPHAGSSDDLVDSTLPRRKSRNHISPRHYWYDPSYVSPSPHAVHMFNSRRLKYAMANEAHMVRKWRNKQPEGRAAGLPPWSHDLWIAFGHRAAELAARTDPRHRDPSEEAQMESRLSKRSSINTTLRFLQFLASVQAGPYSALLRLVDRIMQHHKELKPRQCFHLLQAMSRLRLQHPKLRLVLERMSFSWRTLPDKDFVKAANAVAKLGLGDNMWAKPLKLALVTAIPLLSGQHLANLKSIAVMDLLDESESIKLYLNHCLDDRPFFTYPRHLQMVELHAHLIYPDAWKQLDKPILSFLQEIRVAAERSRPPEAAGIALKSPNSSETGNSDDGEEGGSRTGWFDKRNFSCRLHMDISRVMREDLQIPHQNQVSAGPLLLDMVHLPTMTTVEAGAEWQYYRRSIRPTALARRRHEMLRAMGFQTVIVPHYRWYALPSNHERALFLRKKLPVEIFKVSA